MNNSEKFLCGKKKAHWFGIFNTQNINLVLSLKRLRTTDWSLKMKLGPMSLGY